MTCVPVNRRSSPPPGETACGQRSRKLAKALMPKNATANLSPLQSEVPSDG